LSININSLATPSRNKGFNSTLKDTALKKNMALAFKTFNPYISPKSDHLPLIAATGVLLLKANYITQPYIHYHSFYLKGWTDSS
jgi:hypothetical protein